MTDDLPAPQEIPRAKDGRPFIIPIGGGKPRAYTRCSTFARALEDGAALMNWKQRILLRGILRNAVVIPPDLDPLDYSGPAGALIEELMHVGGGNDAAIFGTACHALAEYADFTSADIIAAFDPNPDYLAWLDRYINLTKDLTMVVGEVFVVNDTYTCAGTLDRLLRLPDGRLVVGDIKTGNTLRLTEYAIQIALYAGGSRYDPATGDRTQLHPDLDPDLGVVIHVPAPKNGLIDEPRLIPLDLAKGRALADLALQVRQSRSTLVYPDLDAWQTALHPTTERTVTA